MSHHRCSCELDIVLASKVQNLLFPKSSPVCSWACIGVKNRMANALGGDYFDFIAMPDGCQAVFVGDVTGHGVHASVVMALLYGFIHHSAQEMCDPLALVRQTNAFLRTFAERSVKFDHYFSSTLFYGVIDPQRYRLHYVNAGHPAPLVRRGEQILSLEVTAPPIGFFKEPEISLGFFQLQRHDRLLLFTDGVTDTFDPEQQSFGRARLAEVLRRHQGDHMEFLETLYGALDEFGGDSPSGDDCTAIVLDLHQF
jgi:serine phosphatase RsbU (regulator of sigma subunit)